MGESTRRKLAGEKIIYVSLQEGGSFASLVQSNRAQKMIVKVTLSKQLSEKPNQGFETFTLNQVQLNKVPPIEIVLMV